MMSRVEEHWGKEGGKQWGIIVRGRGWELRGIVSFFHEVLSGKVAKEFNEGLDGVSTGLGDD